jgi:hypothetical protein
MNESSETKTVLFAGPAGVDPAAGAVAVRSTISMRMVDYPHGL